MIAVKPPCSSTENADVAGIEDEKPWDPHDQIVAGNQSIKPRRGQDRIRPIQTSSLTG